MIVESIPASWRAWLEENVARGCNQVVLATELVKGGILDQTLALQAVREVMTRLDQPRPPIERPMPRFEAGWRVIDGHHLRLVSETLSPRIMVIENFLTAEECGQIIESGRDALAEVDVVDPVGGAVAKHPARTGEYTTFPRGHSRVIDRLEQRIAAFLAWPVDRGEGFQLIHYKVGDEYQPHYDWFDPDNAFTASHMTQGGQRIATLIMYLNQPAAGGGTLFPMIGGLTLQARPGWAVYFDNLDEDGKPDRRTLHAGQPVLAGEKWIATKWLRVAPY